MAKKQTKSAKNGKRDLGDEILTIPTYSTTLALMNGLTLQIHMSPDASELTAYVITPSKTYTGSITEWTEV